MVVVMEGLAGELCRGSTMSDGVFSTGEYVRQSFGRHFRSGRHLRWLVPGLVLLDMVLSGPCILVLVTIYTLFH